MSIKPANAKQSRGLQKVQAQSINRQLIQLAYTKAIMNLKAEASRTYLSYAWWMLEPMMHMAVYYFVFGIMFKHGGQDFVLFLLVGITHWLWFSKSVGNATASITLGSSLMMRVPISKIFFPLVIVIQDAIKQLPVFALLVGFLLVLDVPIYNSWLAWPVIIICEFILILTCSIIVAAIIPFMPDLSILVSTGLQFMMFVTGVFFSFDMIPEEMRGLFFLNPMAKILKLARDVLMRGIEPDWLVVGELFLFSGLVLMLVIWIVSRIGHIYPRLISG